MWVVFTGPCGAFCSAIHTDGFSTRYTSGPLASTHPAGKEIIETYVSIIQERYEECYVDLGSSFDCQPFNLFLERVDVNL